MKCPRCDNLVIIDSCGDVKCIGCSRHLYELFPGRFELRKGQQDGGEGEGEKNERKQTQKVGTRKRKAESQGAEEEEAGGR